MERLRALAVVSLLLCIWRGAEGLFNTDIREPILRISPGVLNENHFDSFGEDFFGYAIALHQLDEVTTTDGPEETADKTRLFVGAPKGSYPGGLILDPPVGALNNTGLVYSCPILPGTCEAVRAGDATDDIVSTEITVTETNDGLSAGQRMFDFRPNAEVRTMFNSLLQAEQKIGQLMGATIFSRNDSLVVCAPSWTSTGFYNPALSTEDNTPALSNALPQGRCYWANRDLSTVTFLDPCNRENEANVKVDQGYCTAGTDVDMLEPDRIVIGSPGFQLGIGTLFYGTNQNQLTRRNSRASGRGNIDHVSPQTDGQEEILETAQGFQVATGYITMPRGSVASPPNSLASVPRYDSTLYLGKIDIYDARSTGGDIQDLLSITAEGQQIAEFFGYALATADLNGDGYDEVIVGAPMYSRIVPESEVQVEIGRVYSFINTQGNLTATPIIFEGTSYRGRLGMNVINIGDIDLDGYEDIAVSAPYEEVGAYTGVVYIYYGAEDPAVFSEQTPAKITAEEVGERLNISLQTFGFSLSALDVDNNQYNDLAIGAVESSTIVVLRSRPVADVILTVTASPDSVVRANPGCNIEQEDEMYSCFNVMVSINVTGEGIPNVIEVDVVLRELRSNGEQRLFFDQDTENIMIRLPVSSSTTTTVYVLNGITDTVSPLELIAEVEQHQVSMAPSPTSGTPDINDLSEDYIIRQPVTAGTQVMLTNDCGPDDMCQTDFAIFYNETIYLHNGMALPEFESIEEGVTHVTVVFTIDNRGDEDALVLMLNVTLSDSRVFMKDFEVNVDNDMDECSLNELCNLGDVLAVVPSKMFSVTFAVATTDPQIEFTATFSVTSSETMDSNPSNNVVTVDFLVDRRADLQVSVIFPQDRILYADIEPDPEERADVGMPVSMVVTVSNVRGTEVDAQLRIYYPARAPETGDYFFLLPACGVETAISGGTIDCDDSGLLDISDLPCSQSRRRRSVNSAMRQRLRAARGAARGAGNLGLRQMMQESNGLNCSVTPEKCESIVCSITQLQGLEQNEARVTLMGYVDERFFFDKDMVYDLTAYVSVSFNETVEEAIDSQIRPDDDSALVTLRPLNTGSDGGSSSGESLVTIVIVIVVVIFGAILFICVVAVILYCCGFFKRKKKVDITGTGEEQEGAQGPVVAEVPEKQPPAEGTDF